MCSDSLQHFQFPLMYEPVCFCLMCGTTPMHNLDIFIALWVLPAGNCSLSIFCRSGVLSVHFQQIVFTGTALGQWVAHHFFIFSSALWKLSCTYCVHHAYSLLVCTAYTCVITKCNENRSSQEWLWEPRTVYWIVGILTTVWALARVVYLAAWN